MADAPRAASEGAIGRLIGAGLLLVGLLLCGWGAYGTAYATGLAGTHGTLAVDTCAAHYHGGSRHHGAVTQGIECHGTFRSDDGAVKDLTASVDTDSRYPARAHIPLQWTGSDYVSNTADRTCATLLPFFLGLVALGPGLFLVATRYRFSGGEDLKQAMESRAGAATQPVMVWCIVGGVAAAVVDLVVKLFV